MDHNNSRPFSSKTRVSIVQSLCSDSDVIMNQNISSSVAEGSIVNLNKQFDLAALKKETNSIFWPSRVLDISNNIRTTVSPRWHKKIISDTHGIFLKNQMDCQRNQTKKLVASRQSSFFEENASCSDKCGKSRCRSPRCSADILNPEKTIRYHNRLHSARSELESPTPWSVKDQSFDSKAKARQFTKRRPHTAGYQVHNPSELLISSTIATRRAELKRILSAPSKIEVKAKMEPNSSFPKDVSPKHKNFPASNSSIGRIAVETTTFKVLEDLKETVPRLNFTTFRKCDHSQQPPSYNLKKSSKLTIYDISKKIGLSSCLLLEYDKKISTHTRSVLSSLSKDFLPRGLRGQKSLEEKQRQKEILDYSPVVINAKSDGWEDQALKIYL